MESLAQSDFFVFWSAITLMVVVPAVTGAVAHYWYSTRRAEFDARLKSYMLELGMSAEDIKTVIEAESKSKDGSVVIGNAYYNEEQNAS